MPAAAQEQVDRDQHDHQSRQNGDMESKKSGERGSGDLFPAAQEDHHRCR